MAKPEQIEILTPPNPFKGKALPKLDADAVERAERALKTLAVEFDSWMDEELFKLESSWNAVKADGIEGENGQRLFLAAHDIKGLGTTYNFPLVTRLAAPLCRLIETPELRVSAPSVLVSGLINAIRISIRQRIRTDDHPTGRALAQESEAIVSQMLRP